MWRSFQGLNIWHLEQNIYAHSGLYQWRTTLSLSASMLIQATNYFIFPFIFTLKAKVIQKREIPETSRPTSGQFLSFFLLLKSQRSFHPHLKICSTFDPPVDWGEEEHFNLLSFCLFFILLYLCSFCNINLCNVL